MSEKSKFSALVILAVVFTIGGLFGVGGTVAYLKQTRGNRGDRSAHTERSPRDIYRAQVDRMMERLEKSLSLTESQVPLVRAEVTKFGDVMLEVHESMRQRFLALMEERSLAIERHLNEEQLAAFREEQKKHRDRDKAIRERRKNGGKDGAMLDRIWKPGSSPSASRERTCRKDTC